MCLNLQLPEERVRLDSQKILPEFPHVKARWNSLSGKVEESPELEDFNNIDLRNDIDGVGTRDI